MCAPTPPLMSWPHPHPCCVIKCPPLAISSFVRRNVAVLGPQARLLVLFARDIKREREWQEGSTKGPVEMFITLRLPWRFVR